MEPESPLKKIVVRPLAFESLGVRSMCTYVETPDVRILLDAGVSLGPRRFGFPPHPREYKAIEKARRLIVEAAERADVVTVSHYHFDHHTPSYTDWAYNWSSEEIARSIYEGKLVLAKSYRTDVNFSQRRRGWLFARTCGKYARRLETADGRTFRFGDTTIKFSKPVFHGGEGSRVGWVLMATIRHGGDALIFTSDVQGPIVPETCELILAENPKLAIVGGPPLYLIDFALGREELESAVENLKRIVRKVPTTILDHHVLREKDWRRPFKAVFEEASQAGHRVVTAAEFMGEENLLLEARRRELFEEEPPSGEFVKWMRTPSWRRRLTKPPL
ncbi:MAG TPA: hypothetical protein ENF85_03695 [Candidatus Bathyarchaeota archaeon]|nr:hypothetical protein [Candidatus Bathyarchaeota archaeon]